MKVCNASGPISLVERGDEDIFFHLVSTNYLHLVNPLSMFLLEINHFWGENDTPIYLCFSEILWLQRRFSFCFFSSIKLGLH